MTLYDSILKKGEQRGEKKGEKRGEKRGMQYTLEIIGMLKNNEEPKEIARKFNVDIEFVLKLKKEIRSISIKEHIKYLMSFLSLFY